MKNTSANEHTFLWKGLERGVRSADAAPGDDRLELEGGHAAERLREFLEKRLPPGASAEEVAAEIEKIEKEKANKEEPNSEKEQDTSGAAEDGK